MEFGVTQIGGNERSAVQQGIDAEAWGYSIFWAPEFLALPTLEPFAVLSAAAQHTKTIRLGTGVAGLALRSPIQLAKAAVTTDILSDGRLVLGLGLGGVVPKDLEVEGIPNLRERGRVSNERLDILYRLFTEKSISHSGEYYKFDDFTLSPDPVQKAPRPHLDRGPMDWQDCRRRPQARRDIRQRVHLSRRHPHKLLPLRQGKGSLLCGSRGPRP